MQLRELRNDGSVACVLSVSSDKLTNEGDELYVM